MTLEDRIAEVAVVRPGDKLIIRVPNGMPLDPYSPESAETQLETFARRLREWAGADVSVVVLAGSLELTIIRAGER